MENVMWFYLFWAAIASLAAALIGLLVLAWHRRQEERRMNDGGKEIYLSYDSPDFAGTAGFCMECPQTELLKASAYWLVDDRVAQIVYDLAPAQQITLRAALNSEAGVPFAEADDNVDYDSETVCYIDDVRVTLRQVTGGFASAEWVRDGVDYLLYGKGLQMNALGGMLPIFISRTAVRQTV